MQFDGSLTKQRGDPRYNFWQLPYPFAVTKLEQVQSEDCLVELLRDVMLLSAIELNRQTIQGLKHSANRLKRKHCQEKATIDAKYSILTKVINPTHSWPKNTNA